jgi:hypothetical protein
MKSLLLLYYLLTQFISFSQSKDTAMKSIDKGNRPEIFTNGFIDVVNNGQVNASARFLRLFLGEQGKFTVPLSIYSGVSSNNFQNVQAYSGQRSNESLVINFINPLSGLVNFSIDGILFQTSKKTRLTKPGFLYHVGERVLTGYKTGSFLDPLNGKPINFLNSFASTGFYFQTGAWERSNAKNTGIFWMAIRLIGCYTTSKQLKEIISDIKTDGIYTGYSVAGGVEINNLVNLKILYYKYIKKPEIDYAFSIYQLSFNYSIKN